MSSRVAKPVCPRAGYSAVAVQAYIGVVGAGKEGKGGGDGEERNCKEANGL